MKHLTWKALRRVLLNEVPSSINEEDKMDWVIGQSTLLQCDKSFNLARRCELKTLLNVLALLQILTKSLVGRSIGILYHESIWKESGKNDVEKSKMSSFRPDFANLSASSL